MRNRRRAIVFHLLRALAEEMPADHQPQQHQRKTAKPPRIRRRSIIMLVQSRLDADSVGSQLRDATHCKASGRATQLRCQIRGLVITSQSRQQPMLCQASLHRQPLRAAGSARAEPHRPLLPGRTAPRRANRGRRAARRSHRRRPGTHRRELLDGRHFLRPRQSARALGRRRPARPAALDPILRRRAGSLPRAVRRRVGHHRHQRLGRAGQPSGRPHDRPARRACCAACRRTSAPSRSANSSAARRATCTARASASSASAATAAGWPKCSASFARRSSPPTGSR